MTHKILKKFYEYCEENKFRLTAPRAEVLKIIIASKKPLGAYEILDKLKKVFKNPKPPTVYRSIEFLQDKNFIHRIESLNAYVACHIDHLHKDSQFMICDDCGIVIETHQCEIPKFLKDSAEKNTFTPSRWNFEVHGICAKCI